MPRLRKYDGVVYRRRDTLFWWIRYRDRSGARRRESTFTQDWQEAQRLLRERLQARDSNALDVIRKGEKLSLEQWADFFLENYSKPPVRAEKTHQVNLRVAKHLKTAFASRKLVDITADDIEIYLSDRLRKTVRVRTALGYRQMGVLKPTTVHQELRVLRRMLNVAVRKKLLQAKGAWIRADSLAAVRRRCQQGPVDRAICTTAADERPAPPTALRCSRNASVARPPFDETRSDTVPFVSSPLRSSFPCKVCHFRLSQSRGSVHGWESTCFKSMRTLYLLLSSYCL